MSPDRRTPAVRVLLVDDQPLIREGLRRILRDGFDIVAECDDGDEVGTAVDKHAPDVVVMDVRMKRVDGATATKHLRATRPDGPPVVVLTTFDDDETLSAALRAGAAGFLLKDAPGEDLVRAVRTVASGGAWLDPSVTARVLSAYRSASPPNAAMHRTTLTARELDVLRLIARGANNAEIATALCVGDATVKSHVGHIFTKLGLRDRAAAIVYAYDAGLVEPGVDTQSPTAEVP